MSAPGMATGVLEHKMGWIIRCAAVVVLLMGMFTLVLNCWPMALMLRCPSVLNSPVQHLLLPKAAIVIAWQAYEDHRFVDAASLAEYFNAWQPTAETTLFEGRCRQELGESDQARALYKLAQRFDPRSRSARLGLIDLDLKISQGTPPAIDTVDALLSIVPWDDAVAIDTIAARLAGMAEGESGAVRLQFAARILYLAPSHQHLRKAGLLLLQDASQAEDVRRIGAWVIIASLLEERGRLGEGDILRLDQLIPGWAGPRTKSALGRGEFTKVPAAGMRNPDWVGWLLSSGGDGAPFLVCFEREWLMQLGATLRELDERH